MELSNKAGSNIKINYAEGAGVFSNDWEIVPAKYLSNDNDEGLKAEYFNNITLSGERNCYTN